MTRTREVWNNEVLLGINPQVDVDLVAVVEMADGLGIALLAIELGVDLVVDVGRELGEMIGPVGPYNVTLDRLGARVGKVDHGIRNWIVLPVDHLASQHTSRIGLFVT